jgi:hypothetical protein
MLGFTYGYCVNRFQIFPYATYTSLRDYFKSNPYKPYSTNQIDSFSNFLSKRLIVKPSNVDSLRAEVTKVVFNSSKLPSYYPSLVTKIIDDTYSDLINLKSIQEFRVNLSFGFCSVGYIFHPKKSNSRLLLYHQGHDGDFVYGKHAISYFLRRGYTIYAFSLPLLGKNNRPVVVTENYGNIQFNSNHDYFKFLPKPLSYFIEPIIIMINYAQKFSFKSISMVGLSGGGWATTIAAALDTRINFSFPVAGTYPLALRFIRPESNYGDFEQVYPPLMQSADYLDLYILASVGKNRSQMQILNLHDPCCFNGYEYQLYHSFLSSEILKYQSARFSLISDSLNKNHSISDMALNLIIREVDTLSR